MNFLLAGMTTLLLQNPLAGASQTISHNQELVFQVLLDDKYIGTHSFRFASHGGRETVDINADFDMTFLAIPIYSYDHRNRETWNNGCLETVKSHTDDNGDEYRINGRHIGSVFEVVTRHEVVELQSDCVMSFAYWDRRILSQNKLLNSQTGDYLPINIKAVGTEQLQLDRAKVTAQRYNLRSEDKGIDISIWYNAESGKWLSLESRLDGRVIRYLPTESRHIKAKSERHIRDRE